MKEYFACGLAKNWACPVRRYVIKSHEIDGVLQKDRIFESRDEHENHEDIAESGGKLVKKVKKVLGSKIQKVKKLRKNLRIYREIALDELDGKAMLINSGQWRKAQENNTNEGKRVLITILFFLNFAFQD